MSSDATTTTSIRTANTAAAPPSRSPDTPDPHTSTRDHYAVTTEQLVLEDASRSAPTRAGSIGLRELRTLVLRPEVVGERVPLIVFAHGYDTEPETYLPLLDAWAAAGYEVAAPELPGSAADLPGPPQRDINDQAVDLSFVASAIVNRDAAIVDPARLIAAGHSDGASAVALIALNSFYRDDRFNDYIVLSGAIPDQVLDGTWGEGVPAHHLLVVVGDADEYDNLPAAHELYDSTAMSAALVVVPGGDHQHMYIDDSATAAAVRALSVDFLDSVTGRASQSVSWDVVGHENGFGVESRPQAPGSP